MNLQKMCGISHIVFCGSLVIVLIYVISLFFPALIVSLASDSEGILDPFEPGIWAIPILVTNLILIGLGILYFTNRLPRFILNSINFILNFEVSPKITFIVIRPG